MEKKEATFIDVENVRNELFKFQDFKYQKFNSQLCPGVKNIIGVRMPDIRKIAKKLLENNYINYIEDSNKKYYEEIMLEGLLISQAKISFSDKEKDLNKFIPKINCWAITDICASSFKIEKTDLAKSWKYLTSYENSIHEYELRFVIVMWINHFLIDEYIDEVLNKIDKIKSGYYYVKMAVAWLLSISYIKYPKKTKQYLNKNNLDDWTYNKALQKIIESTRITKGEKDMIRKMKRKKVN